MNEAARIAAACQDAFAKVPVACAYLFGSRARGTHRRDSDVDIAILGTGQQESVLAPLLCEALGTDDIDLVRLDQAPPVLAYRIISEGELIHEGNQRDRLRQVTRILSEYQDFYPTYQRFLASYQASAMANR